MNDDMYRVSQETAICLTDHNSVPSASQLLSDSSFQSLQTNLKLGSNNLKLSYQVDQQRMHNKRGMNDDSCDGLHFKSVT